MNYPREDINTTPKTGKERCWICCAENWERCYHLYGSNLCRKIIHPGLENKGCWPGGNDEPFRCEICNCNTITFLMYHCRECGLDMCMECSKEVLKIDPPIVKI